MITIDYFTRLEFISSRHRQNKQHMLVNMDEAEWQQENGIKHLVTSEIKR